MRDDVFEELQVGEQAANAKLAQRAIHAGRRLVGVVTPGRDLHQQRVVKRRNHRAGVGGSGVQPDPKAGGAAIGGEAAVVGRETILRIFGGDAALHRVPIEADLLLSRQKTIGIADLRAFADADLCLHQIDAGHFLGNRMLYLDARIDLDKVELAAVGVQ